jgi:hypothetical protein
MTAPGYNPRSIPKDAKIFGEKSIDMYLRAASFFPDDEPQKQVPPAA